MAITIQQHYGPDPLQTIEIFSSSGNPKSSLWVIYIHGGAWVDKRNTAQDCKSLFDYLLTKNNNSDIGYASINYRLSPPAKHPNHIQDILNGIKLLNPKKYVLIGHSAGGFLALQSLIYNYNIQQQQPLGIIISEGIYDLPTLLDEYPDYHSFIDLAFSNDQNVLLEASPARRHFIDSTTVITHHHDDNNLVKYNGKIILIHSNQDQLLSNRQHSYFIHHALENFTNYTLFEIDAGLHDDVYISKNFFDIVNNYISSL